MLLANNSTYSKVPIQICKIVRNTKGEYFKKNISNKATKEYVDQQRQQKVKGERSVRDGNLDDEPLQHSFNYTAHDSSKD